MNQKIIDYINNWLLENKEKLDGKLLYAAEVAKMFNEDTNNDFTSVRIGRALKKLGYEQTSGPGSKFFIVIS